MHVELDADELETKLREKERVIAARWQRIMPRNDGQGGGLGGSFPLQFGDKQRRMLLWAGGALVLMGLPAEVRPRRVEARLKPNRLGQLVFVTGLTLIAFAVGRRLGHKPKQGVVIDTHIEPKDPPPAGTRP